MSFLQPRLLQYLLLVIPAALSSCTAFDGITGNGKSGTQIVVPVYYATDRAVSGTPGISTQFTGERGQLSFGRAEVQLSLSKQEKSPYADPQRWQLVTENAVDRNELGIVTRLDSHEFLHGLNEPAPGEYGRSVVVYIHGYSKRFDSAVINTARLAFEMNLQSTPVLYSWPSAGLPANYLGDLANANWSTYNLKQLLVELAASSEIDTVHLVAHSMGNHTLLRALLRLANDREFAGADKLGRIVLFAPDIDRDVFRRDHLPLLQLLEADVTLYVSSVDVPLNASKTVNRVPRLGDASAGIFVTEGMETVDVSTVASILDGHSSHRDNAITQADLHYLFNDNLPASRRPTLRPAEGPSGRYWEIDPKFRVVPDARP